MVSTGLRGVGNSYLVMEWVHPQLLSGRFYLIVWQRGRRVPDVQADLEAMGEILKIPNPPLPEKKSPHHRAFAVSLWMGKNLPGVHLVFDNATNYQDLLPYLPSQSGCIFTARNRGTFPSGAVLRLGPFTEAESLELRERLSGRKVLGEEIAAPAALCTAVGHLPLAVTAQAAYTNASCSTISDLREQLASRAASACDLDEQVAGYEHKASVTEALLLVYSLLDNDSRSTLHRLDLLAAERVPSGLLGAGAKRTLLFNLDVISYPAGGMVSIHNLFQRVTRPAGL